ncbi:glycosyl hydrolase [Athalassotoga saccharophila]|uniref:glycosyl hydrolase n=1 Tax=Athalassotoga saccharophila TaxID=1441386 RepID=UPI001379BE07|nr:glycosyl hydrolase [Athalassotoga saccharophila]BBJ27374.1 hypothetical protein ATHSA_0242 [Athalassotoga saccharophila]
MNLKSFKLPKAIYRAYPFFSLNDKLDKDEIERQTDEFANKGYGGSFLHTRVGLITGYLSSDWMKLTRASVKAAQKTKTYAWLYDEDKWPSGFAGGEVPKLGKPYRNHALILIADTKSTENDKVLSEFDHEGHHYSICVNVAPLGDLWFNKTSYVDLMNPNVTKAFLESTHEKYKKSCGEYFGNVIPGIFMDEPCYLMDNLYNVPAVPWSDFLPEYFKKIKGYSIEDHLKELFFDEGDYQKIRFDFYDTATRLFLESWTKQYFDWCEKNNLKMTGHFMAEDTLVSQTQWIGAAMPHYEFMHQPGIDKLGRNLEPIGNTLTVKQLTSVGDQLGKERMLCEAFGTIGQQSSFYHRKWIADWLVALGINFINPHLSLYSMRGERKRDYPANLFYQQPWWDRERHFADYMARISYFATQGKRNVDILVIHPISSVWSEYSPLHEKDNFMVETNLYDKPLETLSKSLIASKLDFHYGDEIIMEKHAKIENGKLVIGNYAYSTVIVPPSLTLRSKTFELLSEFSKLNPKRLIFISPTLTRIDGIKREVKIPEDAIVVSSVNDALQITDTYYKDRINVIDMVTGQNAEKIICHQRTSKDGKTIFFANTDKSREINAKTSLSDTKVPYLLDAMTGNIYKIPYSTKHGRQEIDVKFYPASSMMIYYPNESIDVPMAPQFLDSGIEFEGNLKREFVKMNWDVKPLEPNVMPLDKVTLEIDGKRILEDDHISKAWQPFYDAQDGTSFRAIYSFDVVNVPKGELFAVVELAENLGRIILNQTEVKPLKKRGEMGAFDPDKSWKGVNFTKIPITTLLKKGKNTLMIEGKKYNNVTGPGTHVRVENFKDYESTEVDTAYIIGDFEVLGERFGEFAIDGKSKKIGLNLTKSGYPFYAGKTEFSGKLKIQSKSKDKVYLELTDVNAAYVELYVNEKSSGVKYWKSYVFDVTELIKEGENEIKVIASTTLFNLMGPNWIANILKDEFVGPGTFRDFKRFTKDYTFIPFGIGDIMEIKR